MGATMLNSRPANARVKLDRLPAANTFRLSQLSPLVHSHAARRFPEFPPYHVRSQKQAAIASPLLLRPARAQRRNGLLVIVIALGAGMFGYHHFEGMPWIDAFANAAMILSGMGPLATLTTAKGKLFAGFYALFSGLVFVVVMGIVFAPVVHRFMHRFHLEKTRKTASRVLKKGTEWARKGRDPSLGAVPYCP